MSQSEELQNLRLTARLDDDSAKAGDTVYISISIVNPTNRTIVAKFPDACTDPALSTPAGTLTPPSIVCAQVVTYALFQPRQVHNTSVPIFLQDHDRATMSPIQPPFTLPADTWILEPQTTAQRLGLVVRWQESETVVFLQAYP